MPSLTVSPSGSDRPINLFYLDSGQPSETEIYTTIVIIHGHSFHSGIFQRALPLAASRRLRLICVNRRDYAETTLFSSSELKILSEGDETERAAFVEQRGVEFALFLNQLIDELSLPPPTTDGKDGGIALMGWSLGNVVALAIVASISSFPGTVKARLQKYVRVFMIHSAPGVALGLPKPQKYYNPTHDESIPESQRGDVFAHWASGYFSHGQLSERNLDSLAYRDSDPSRKPTVARMSHEELVSVIDYAPGPRSELYFNTRFEDTLFQQTSKVLFDFSTTSLWPRMTIWMVYGDSSAWMVVYSAWEIEKLTKDHGERMVKLLPVEGENTFMFWDNPEKALDACVYCLEN
ncbi:hypothetical protein K439DRAFT_1521297 [Ramaria rubella]|nr:hypothetical protein K439DRAFT_1521297 [Ramaria rubella]